MSNALAIAAVTATLRNRILKIARDELKEGLVSTLPIDKVREAGQDQNQINIYLYQALSNAAWTNRNLPSRVKPGETGAQPLALNLYYLITPYSSNADSKKFLEHRLLGLILQTLNDYPVLGRREIEEALPESDLQTQIEKVRFSQIDLSLEDMSRIWTTSQTEYRLSVAYEASVVLIEGSRPTRTPLPVLSVNTSPIQPDLTLPTPSVPTLEAIALPNEQTSIRLKETLTIRGYNLSGDETMVIFEHPRLTDPIEIPPQPGGTDRQLQVRLEETIPNWLAGIYTVTLRVRQNNQQHTTNALSLYLAPSITRGDIEIVNNLRLLPIKCLPEVLLWQEDERNLRGQTVFLLIGDRELQPRIAGLSSTPGDRTSELVFDITNIKPGEYFVRLRIDRVDSILVDRSVKPPVFDSSVKLPIA